MINEKKSTKKQKIIVGAILAVLLALFIGLTFIIGAPLVRYASDPDRFRELIDDLGILGKLTYAGISALQVLVALIPGEPVEILGGYAFGTIEGTLLYLIGAFAGSMAVFGLVRKFGKRAAEIFFSKEKMESIKFLQTSPKKTLLFTVIFSIPGTPKDLLAYYAGLTDMKLWVWSLICTLGRIPAVITSAISGDALGSEKYTSAIVTVAVTLVVSAVGLVAYKIICRNNAKQENKQNKE